MGAAALTAPRGETSARTTSTARKHRNSGLSTLPIQVSSSPGRSEKNSTAPKNTREKSASARRWSAPGRSCCTPTVQETVAQRGMANSGPMVRYSTQVKNRP